MYIFLLKDCVWSSRLIWNVNKRLSQNLAFISSKLSLRFYFVTCLNREGVTIKDWPVWWNIPGPIWDQFATKIKVGPGFRVLSFCRCVSKFSINFGMERYIINYSRPRRQRSYGVMVSTQDSESCDPSSSLGRTSLFSRLKLNPI